MDLVKIYNDMIKLNTEVLTTPRGENEDSLVEIVGDRIKIILGDNWYNMYINDQFIKSINDMNQYVQRISLNKYFREILFITRASYNVNLTDVIALLRDDISIPDWLNLIFDIVLPTIVLLEKGEGLDEIEYKINNID